eukprot:6181133-Pleurochrysis_carterae.AAC.1
MPPRAPSHCFAFTLAVLRSHRLCTSRALALCALSFQSSRAHDRRRPRDPDRRPPAGAASLRACARSRTSTVKYSEVFPARPDGSI